MRRLTYLWQCCGIFANTTVCPGCGLSIHDPKFYEKIEQKISRVTPSKGSPKAEKVFSETSKPVARGD